MYNFPIPENGFVHQYIMATDFISSLTLGDSDAFCLKKHIENEKVVKSL